MTEILRGPKPEILRGSLTEILQGPLPEILLSSLPEILLTLLINKFFLFSSRFLKSFFIHFVNFFLQIRFEISCLIHSLTVTTAQNSLIVLLLFYFIFYFHQATPWTGPTENATGPLHHLLQ